MLSGAMRKPKVKEVFVSGKTRGRPAGSVNKATLEKEKKDTSPRTKITIKYSHMYNDMVIVHKVGDSEPFRIRLPDFVYLISKYGYNVASGVIVEVHVAGTLLTV